jgi:hypothetical protein
MILSKTQKAPNDQSLADDRHSRNYEDWFNFCCGAAIRANPAGLKRNRQRARKDHELPVV